MDYDAGTGNVASEVGVGHRRCPLQYFYIDKTMYPYMISLSARIYV